MVFLLRFYLILIKSNLRQSRAWVSSVTNQVDIKEAVGLYEFSVVLRSLFDPDGSMLHCSSKSTLMHILEKFKGESSIGVTSETSTENADVRVKVAIVDAMAEVQSLGKPDWINTCKHLAEHFNNRLFSKTRRQGSKDPVYYRITDSTHIGKVLLKKLRSHTKTKAELTAFLAKKVKERGEAVGRQIVVAWGTECEATHKDMAHLQSDHEEADTKMILHALDATDDGATHLSIHSPDTDVLVLAIRRYSELCPNTSFVTGRAFREKGRSCWKEFLEADDSILSSLGNLGREEQPDVEIKSGIEKFVCQIYVPKTDLTTVKELRWSLFKKKQAESDRLPPTQAALHQATLRAHFQLMFWNKDAVPNPLLPSPSDYGWAMENREWVPVNSGTSYNLSSAGAQRSDARPIDASAAELGFSVQTSCVAVLMIVNVRTSKMATFIRVTWMKVMKVMMTKAAMSKSLSKDAKSSK
ncbi:hypothetical protein ACROYT_G034330 [Oculina patagonica]